MAFEIPTKRPFSDLCQTKTSWNLELKNKLVHILVSNKNIPIRPIMLKQTSFKARGKSRENWRKVLIRSQGRQSYAWKRPWLNCVILLINFQFATLKYSGNCLETTCWNFRNITLDICVRYQCIFVKRAKSQGNSKQHKFESLTLTTLSLGRLFSYNSASIIHDTAWIEMHRFCNIGLLNENLER